ncbi:uncharacterized protein K452DRAFT_2439 [Aplosporella prunicola CBS 121167]|uniref:Uncharacterized protein n=1 Tax=Aplosporella prunicola CBS 121167 TaxID=1176127 RepID=A0A6A6BUW6_9PEZI|nr:uncharacterized protein K452DRAFT_2439 [Aplosporella prunicola CBS 121167]KAF2147143.1 hypothetical protein K452DRAFT_2439 [Aplosporella prunicola CBS 121167]
MQSREPERMAGFMLLMPRRAGAPFSLLSLSSGSNTWRTHPSGISWTYLRCHAFPTPTHTSFSNWALRKSALLIAR